MKADFQMTNEERMEVSAALKLLRRNYEKLTTSHLANKSKLKIEASRATDGHGNIHTVVFDYDKLVLSYREGWLDY